MNRFIILFGIGGIGYCSLELLWRGRTHWSMFLLGGACFYLLYIAFSQLEAVPLLLKALIGAGIITAAEFLTGCIVNLYLDWNVWSYSSAPYNILGQICLPYSLLWFLLSIPIALIIKSIKKYI